MAHELLEPFPFLMPSDWPQVFFANRPSIKLPVAAPAPAATATAHPSSAGARVSEAPSKWPNVFLKQPVQTVAQPLSTYHPAIIPPLQKPVQTARIPLPARSDLPTVTLPKRIPVPETAAVVSRGPTPTPAKIPSLKLTNGESVSGAVLSETPDLIFLQHEILGVVTIPKKAIASRFVEILLLNGDTVSGELITDTIQFMVVRSPMLGTLTVPLQAIRSVG